MDIILFISVGGVGLVAILQHLKIEADCKFNKAILSDCREENKHILRISQQAKEQANRHLTELEYLRREYVSLQHKNTHKKTELPPKYKEDLQGDIFQTMFKKGRKALLLETHPDHGGTREAMEEVEAAFEVLKNIKPCVQKEWSYLEMERIVMQRRMSGLANMGHPFQGQATEQWRSQFSNPYYGR